MKKSFSNGSMVMALIALYSADDHDGCSFGDIFAATGCPVSDILLYVLNALAAKGLIYVDDDDMIFAKGRLLEESNKMNAAVKEIVALADSLFEKEVEV